MKKPKTPFYRRTLWKLLKRHNFIPEEHYENPEKSSLKWRIKATLENSTPFSYMLFDGGFYCKHGSPSKKWDSLEPNKNTLYVELASEDRILIEYDVNHYIATFVPVEKLGNYLKGV